MTESSGYEAPSVDCTAVMQVARPASIAMPLLHHNHTNNVDRVTAHARASAPALEHARQQLDQAAP